MASRLFSLLIAIAYLTHSYITTGPAAAAIMGLYLLLPLMLIWFSDAAGDHTGWLTPYPVSEETPACFVALGGWLLLALPVIGFVIGHLTGP